MYFMRSGSNTLDLSGFQLKNFATKTKEEYGISCTLLFG